MCGGVHAVREGSGHFVAGGRTNLDFDAVFSDDEFLGWEIEDLPGIVTNDGLVAQRCAAAAGATPEAMNEDVVGMFRFGKGVAWVPVLSP